jgi:hypothetical protein
MCLDSKCSQLYWQGTPRPTSVFCTPDPVDAGVFPTCERDSGTGVFCTSDPDSGTRFFGTSVFCTSDPVSCSKRRRSYTSQVKSSSRRMSAASSLTFFSPLNRVPCAAVPNAPGCRGNGPPTFAPTLTRASVIPVSSVAQTSAPPESQTAAPVSSAPQTQSVPVSSLPESQTVAPVSSVLQTQSASPVPILP